MGDVDGYYLLASSVAAVTARICTHPIDTIKTRLQVANVPWQPQHSRYQWFRQAVFPDMVSTSRTSAFLSLYRGLPVTLLFSVPALSVYLSCYELTKNWLDIHARWLKRDAIGNHLISGCAAEVTAGILFTPMEVMKNRLQTDRHPTVQSRMAGRLARHILQTEGIPGFFKGYWMGLAVFVPHTMTYFATYEELKRWAGGRTESVAQQLPFGTYLWCSTVASVVSITLSTPLDIVKTRWQISAAEQGTAYRQGPLAIALHMWKHEGRWRSLARGLLARIAWGIPTTAISMTVFECLKDWRATKSM
ncbi:mitochondrial carrier domain-containing protein [Radiomyces spectabilis]|uniref:mitochondrial carrier domain-containing protein n=1 Tax=Radiomyces spectabilis TaxID=64574 RepID=UPI00221E6F3B|nr:mitochondrial carrier domain-containing protein [Radiomyces spectabilis]KAI8394165.1 mitochondrial carrier domain-containing protein [Radiomyces spectabilis]